MKKRFAILGLLPIFALAACDNTPQNTSAEIVDVPTEEGKATVYFTMAEASVEIPDYVSVFCTGGFNNWATDPDGAIVFEKLEDSAIYYGFFALEDGDYEFQLTLGYNATSGAPSTGVNWSFKSDECLAASGESGTENLSFTVANGLADLGTHTFSAAPGAVKLINNLTVSITLADAAPEYVTLYMPGNWRNNWACTKTADAMTPSADRKTWTATVDAIVGNTYEAKIVADYTASEGDAFGWDNVILDNGAGGNYTLLVKSSWGDNYTLNINEEDDIEPIAFDWSSLPDPSSTPREVTIVVNSPVALTNTTWVVSGSFNNWGDAVALSASEDAKSFTATIPGVLEGSTIQYGIHEGDWHVAIKGSAENNFSTQINLEGNVTITITLTEDAAAELNTRTATIDTNAWLTTVAEAVATLTQKQVIAG